MKAKPDKAILAAIDKIVAGAVKSTIDAHPDWVTKAGRRNIRSSIAKRASAELYLSFAARRGAA